MTDPFARAARGRFVPVALAVAGLALGWALLGRAAEWTVHGAFPGSTLVTDRTGGVLRLTPAADGQYRLWTRWTDLPPEALEALLLKEDRSFWWNAGVDVPALGRAAWAAVTRRPGGGGASTLTMQLVRLAWGLDSRSVPGKALQAGGAALLTLLVPKTELLEAYLNLAPAGANVQGLGTAARVWLGKAPARLNLSEALALAVLPQDPADRNPGNPRSWPAIEAARSRLAGQWLAAHPDPTGTAAAQLALPLRFVRSLPFLAPHLTTRLLADHPDRRRLDTTLDPGFQRLAETTLRAAVRRRGGEGVTNAAALIVRADTMEVLASVGSVNFWDEAIEGQVDGTRALRSPGSTLKPFLYGLGLEQGLLHPLSTLKDARIHFGGYNPDNFDHDFEGPIRAVDALTKSRNVPAVILSGQVKNPDLYGFLQQAGLKLPFSRDHYGLSIILGGAEVSMEQLAGLYGALAGAGNRAGTVRPLRYLTDEPAGEPRRLLTAPAAWLVRRMLETKARPGADEGWNAGAVKRDPGLSRPSRADAVAYKTGTSIGFRDAWAVGVADGLVTAVWVGNFDGRSNPAFVGLETAAPLLFELVDGWRASGRAAGFARPDAVPDGVATVPVCAVSGGIATDACPQVLEAPFIAGVSPIGVCTVHQVFDIDQTTGLRRSHPIVGVTKPVLYEVWPSDLLELFAQAGLGRTVPPALDPDDAGPGSPAAGRAPQILSPVAGLEYQTAALAGRVPLAAAVASDAQTLWWSVDDKLIGSAVRGEPLLWTPVAGRHRVRVVDDQGRSASRFFEVRP